MWRTSVPAFDPQAPTPLELALSSGHRSTSVVLLAKDGPHIRDGHKMMIVLFDRSSYIITSVRFHIFTLESTEL